MTSDEAELARLAGLSFSHPNGFDRLVIASDPDSGARLRVHVWWNGGRTTGAGHIHNHPWTFASRILAGVCPGADYAGMEKVLLLCTTETKTTADLEAFANALEGALA